MVGIHEYHVQTVQKKIIYAEMQNLLQNNMCQISVS